MSKPTVTTVILNWNNYSDTRDCIDSLQNISYDQMDIVLVDNGSTDGSGERLKSEYPEVNTVLLDENTGFGGGNIVGIRKALDRECDYVWVLNNDVLVLDDDSDVLSNLVCIMEQNEKLGVVTPTVMNYPETDEIWFKQGYIDSKTAHAGHKQNRKWFLNPLQLLEDNKSNITNDRILYNDYIPFCSALVQTEIFKNVGLYPEKYFLYYGDADFCIQISKKGYKIGTDTQSQIHHQVSSSSETTRSPTHLYYLARNKQILFRNHCEKFDSGIYFFFIWWVFLNSIDRAKSLDPEGLKSLLLGAVRGMQGETGRGKYP